MLGIDPLTESEMIEHFGTVILNKRITNAGEHYLVWQCHCGKRCSLAVRLLNTGTEGGTCVCGRAWMIGGSKQTACLTPHEDRLGVKYTFPIIKDSDASWRWWRRHSVGI